MVVHTAKANHIRGTGIAAFFLGIGLAGHPFDLVGALIALVLVAILVVALERPGTTLQTFIVAVVGVLVTSVLQHTSIGPAWHPGPFAAQLYFGLYPGSGVVAIGLALLATASLGRKDAPYVIAVMGTLVGIALFFLL